MDDVVGQVLAVLNRKKLRENTIVLFFGDNGAHSLSDNQGGPYPGEYERLRVGNDNLPWRGHKAGIYEGGIRVPAIVSWPGKLQTREVHTPLHAIDCMPTFCHLAGAKPGDLKWDGQNVWPVIAEAKADMPVRTLYNAAPSFRAQAVRHGDWKLVVTQAGANKKNKSDAARVELFNLASDPGESKNLADKQPEKLAEMQQRLADISACDRDAVAND
jgi:arylsulfatase A-like enzyme